MAAAVGEVPDLQLPEQDFTYVAGKVDRPWSHFLGRWKAMKPHLAASLKKRGADRPLRVVDVGSCTGFFALQAANQHAIADVVAIEGSVGVGNGSAGVDGSMRHILETGAVRSHLRHIQQEGLNNCFLAPEVWDYNRVRELASTGKPVCDAMFLLSVIHHIDGVSKEQYVAAGKSHVQGSVDMIALLLLLAPCHFIELPNPPWLENLYAVYKTPRAILEAAAQASGRKWKITGPIYEAEWFGMRYLWLLEEDLSGRDAPMPEVDVQACPFPVLFRGDEPELENMNQPPMSLKAAASQVPDRHYNVPAAYADAGDGYADDDMALLTLHRGPGPLMGGSLPPMLADPALDPAGRRGGVGVVPSPAPAREFHEVLAEPIDPGLMTLMDMRQPADPRIGAAIAAAPMDLLLAHLALRDAISEAQFHLQAYAASGVEAAPLPDFVNSSESSAAALHV